jgi:predicted transcriptional regulator YheO
MANNDLNSRTVNGQNRREALKLLEKLHGLQKDMECTYEEVYIKGKRSVIERFTPKVKRK